MSVMESLKNLCIKLGKNNSPEYAVVAIATVKGIARPTTSETAGVSGESSVKK